MAYATEEILLVLVLAGTAAIAWSIPISLAILFLIVVLTISYRQIIYEYPEGGGAYIVARNNLGELPALTAAGALMIDYVLTVAVSVAAGIAALTSAVPSLFEHREALGLVAIIFIIVMNLRGVRESGKFFAVPTYFAIGALGVMVGIGTIQALLGQPVSVIAGAPYGSRRPDAIPDPTLVCRRLFGRDRNGSDFERRESLSPSGVPKCLDHDDSDVAGSGGVVYGYQLHGGPLWDPAQNG